jgi:hypothetical protein
MGDQLDRLLSLMEADGQAGKTSPPRVDISEIRERLKDLLILTPRAVLKSPLDGIEIAGILGISEGPRIGQAKEYLTEQVLDGALKPLDKEAAAELLKTWSTENP